MRYHFIFFLITLSSLAAPSFAQSGADYEAHVAWCQSIGGTHNYNASNPVCTPGAAPSYQAPQQQDYYYAPPPPQPDYQAQQRAARERAQKEKDRRQQEEAVRAAGEAAEQAEFLKERDEAVSGLKGFDGGSAGGLKGLGASVAATPQLKGLDDDNSCPPSQDGSVVDLCFRDGEIEEKPGVFDRMKDRFSKKETDLSAEDLDAIGQMMAFARKEGWDKKELERLDRALRNLPVENGRTGTRDDIARIWSDAESRGPGSALAQAAAAGDGPALYRPGEQSHEDCTLYALASAADIPYSAVAARAGEMLRNAEWRPEEDRNNPEKVFDNKPGRPGGLYPGEVAILAEAFGRAEIIPPSEFPAVLKEGRPLIIGVGVPGTGDKIGGHEVVLSKTFRHNGETWYEMIDSNQEGTQRRLYLSAAELDVILLDNGIALRPEAGTTPEMLRNN